MEREKQHTANENLTEQRQPDLSAPVSPAQAERRSGRSFLRRVDLLVIAFVLLVAGGFYLYQRHLASDATTVAVVVIDDAEIARIELKSGAAQDFVFPERPDVVLHRYENGSIAFISSNCPDKVCINSGRLHLPYHQAACLPNQFILTVEALAGRPTESEEIDIVR